MQVETSRWLIEFFCTERPVNLDNVLGTVKDFKSLPSEFVSQSDTFRVVTILTNE